VGQLGSVGGSYTYGVAFLDQSIDFWGMEFPPISQSGERSEPRLAAVRQLQSSREWSNRANLESDVYMVNEGIVRFCQELRFFHVLETGGRCRRR